MDLNPLLVERTNLSVRVKRVIDRIKELKLFVKLYSTDGTNSITVDYSLEQLSIFVDYDNRAEFIPETFVELVKPDDYTGDEYGMMVICTKPGYNLKSNHADIQLCELLIYVNNNQNGKMNLDGFIGLLCELVSADTIGNPNYGRYWLEQGLLPVKYEVTTIQDGGILHGNLASKLLCQSLLIGLAETK